MQFFMTDFFQKITRRNFTLFWCFVYVFSMLYSKFLLSVSSIALLAAAFGSVYKERPFLRFNSQTRANFRLMWSDKTFFAPILWFLAVAGTAFYATQDSAFLIGRLQMKLPFLLLPIAFAAMPRFSERDTDKIFAFFAYLTTLSALIVLVRYGSHFKFFTQKIGEGGSLPTPTNHIRYSLLVAYAAISAAYLWYKGFVWKYVWESKLLLICTIFLTVFQHILAVRSGLVALYLCAFVMNGLYFFEQKKYITILCTWLLLIVLPIIGYQTLPSFKIRMEYAYWEWQQFRTGKGNNSDSDRWVSIQAGIAVGNEHPIMGVGVGNLGVAVHAWQRAHYPQIAIPKLPHNQFVGIYASMGLVGVSIFCWMLVTMWISSYVYSGFWGTTLCLILVSSFLVEDTLDTVQGTAMFLFFTLLLYRRDATNVS
jgi:O-antigen ligase